MQDAAAELPRAHGAYVLLIRLEGRLSLDMPAFDGKSLSPGLYAYCGSAYGPGGIRARVSRHLRAGKPLRWHVDRLTAAGRTERIGVRVGGRECDLVGELLAGGGLAVLPGFGSSDCRTCPAHLLRLPEGKEIRTGLFDLAV
jgi:Uri superfamily endonuclease